jgi:hypothetical protein
MLLNLLIKTGQKEKKKGSRKMDNRKHTLISTKVITRFRKERLIAMFVAKQVIKLISANRGRDNNITTRSLPHHLLLKHI